MGGLAATTRTPGVVIKAVDLRSVSSELCLVLASRNVLPRRMPMYCVVMLHSMRAAHITVVVLLTAAISAVTQVPVQEMASHGFSSSSTIQIATDAVNAKQVPGVCVMAGTAAMRNTSSSPGRAIVFNASIGRFTYDAASSRVTDATLYDLASLTKVTLCATAVALLYQRGYVDLDLRIADASLLGPSFAAHGKGAVTIRQLLTHTAGFPPDPSPGYLFPSFGCPNAQGFFPRQTFECVSRVLTSLCENQTLSHTPGSKFVYSDLSMITLMFVVGKIVKDNALVNPAVDGDPSCTSSELLTCYYLGFVKGSILEAFGLSNASGYLPRDTIAVPPQWNDDELRHRWINGFVSDENSFAMGGVSGHAGFFANINDLSRVVDVWAWPSGRAGRLNQSTVALFTTVVNRSFSSRALGWDTHTISCGSMTKYSTFTHTGFTGTQICVDPVKGIFSIVLANAKYANKWSHAMVHLRPRINSAIVQGFEGPSGGNPEASVGLTVVCVLVAVAVLTAIAVYSFAAKCRRHPQRRAADDDTLVEASVTSSAEC